MSDNGARRLITRRQILRGGAVLGGMCFVRDWPAWAFQGAAAQDALTARRNQLAAAPIVSLTLTESLTMLSGPGGNVVVLNGRDGKILVDSFVQPAWEKLKQTIDGLGGAPVKALIDTHWHFDHADNNANLRKAGAAVLAHDNTTKRMAQSHDLLGMHFAASPPEALPTQTFKDRHSLDASGEQVVLGYIPPAHTDTDIYVHFRKGNVLHLGDVYFNGSYPFIDASTGGTINGMIAGADLGLKVADNATKIVPGHGPLADKKALTACREMLVTVRDRVEKLKTGGRKLEEVVAEKPTKDLDASWGKGFMPADNFVALVYNTL